ncbi:GIY-YIG nuclease family protein [Rhodococcus sp. NPDC019627]|uniref:GIY-YIG nuclease family protein n=1 Tax=unclassified Rhodococcus (in: high G+C Gram-positive bacteria) TaxID=192944 RepID=UPI0033BFC2B5
MSAAHFDASDEAALYLAAPPHTREQVLMRPCPVPASAGVYGWWFRKLPADIETSRCATKGGLTLLYTGISPSKPPTNGKPPSTQNIRKRINTHCTGNAAGSTLRLTLGSLVAEEIGIELRRVGSGNRCTFHTGEPALSQWMAENALVSWIARDAPWELEDKLIATLDLPLNLHGNSRNAFYPHLKAARADAKRRASELPVLPNPGIGGR